MLLPPHHLIDNAGVALNDFYNLCGDVFLHIIRDGNAAVAVCVHFNRGIDRLKKACFVDAGQHEAALVQCLWALGGGSDADGGEGMSDRGKEAALLGQGSAV